MVGRARWCAEPIDLGGGRCVLHPWVLGPDAVPAITDPEAARAAPELAVLSVAAHAEEPGAEHIALAALAAAHDLDRDRGTLYPDFVYALLGRAACAALEEIMAARYEYQSDFARKYFSEGLEKGMAKGQAQGKADALLKLLQLKRFTLTEEQRQRVLECGDEAVLDGWMARVLDARALADVFAE
jgi:flagellar biosynthesis/type III secretory pathway protein FliH